MSSGSNVRSTERTAARLQDRLNPLWLWSDIGCGCNINRPIDSLLAKAGFRIGILIVTFPAGPESRWRFIEDSRDSGPAGSDRCIR